MRKCRAKYWLRESGEWLEFEGAFHQWAAQFMEFNSGPAANYTVALVEDADGQIRECPPDSVRFLQLTNH